MNIDPQAIATLIAVILAAVIQKMDARKVRKDLDKSSVKRDAKLDAIHHLVDGSLAESLRLSVLQTARIAALTKGQPGAERDEEIATEAARKYEEHLARMARVDVATAKAQKLNY